MSQTNVSSVRVYCLDLPFVVDDGFSCGIQERGGSWLLSNVGFEAVWLLGSHMTLAVAHACQAGGKCLFVHDATVSSGPGPYYRGFTIALRHLTRLLWASDQPDTETSS
jgi:hypothetical protein